MKFKKILPIAAAGVLALAVVFGVVGYRTVKAAAPAATNLAFLGHGVRGGFSDQELADALGVSLETLQAAYTTADAAALKQAVDQGLITQDQADQFAAREKRFGGMRMFGGTIDYNALLADALGISTDKLQAAYTQAFTTHINSLVAAGTITQEQADLALGRNALFNNSAFQSAMKSAFEAAVNAAVQAGVITQSQADQILSNQSGVGPKGFGGFGGFDGFEGRGRHRGPGFPGGNWMPGNQNNSTPPTTAPSGGDL
jgi:hypothetical protein